MKKLFLISAFNLSIFSVCLATPVLFPLVSLTGSVNNRTILVQPDKVQNPLVIGTNLVPLFDFTLQPVNGQITTNLLPWGYTIKVDGWPRSAHIIVPDSTNTLNVTSLINTNSFAPLVIYTGGITVNTGSSSNNPTYSEATNIATQAAADASTAATNTSATITDNKIALAAGPVASAYIQSNSYPQVMSSTLSSGQSQLGECWGAMTLPTVVFDFSPYPSTYNSQIPDNETSILQTLNFMTTNGMLASLKAVGRQPVFQIDVGWSARRRTTASFVVTNWGTLMWDTNLFPHGLPRLFDTLHTNGIKVALGIYDYTNQIPAGASGFCCGISGQNIAPYTNGTGGEFIYTNAGYKNVEMLVPQTAEQDISEMRWWGADILVCNDFNANERVHKLMAKVISTAINHLAVPQGFNNYGPYQGGTYGGLPVSYFNVNLGLVDSGFLNTVEQSFLNFFTNRMIYMPYETRTSGQDWTTVGDGTRGYHNGISYENFSFVGGSLSLRRTTADFPGTTKANNGAYVLTSWSGSSSRQVLDAAAMLSACQVIESSSNSLIVTAFPDSTNVAFTAIINDREQRYPIKLTDMGTNVGSAWLKPLANGAFAAYFENEGGATTNVSLNFTAYGAGLGYTVTEVWTGGAVGTFTNTVSTNLASGAYCLLRLDPILPSGGSAFPLVAAANAGGQAITNASDVQTTNAHIQNLTVTGAATFSNATINASNLNLQDSIVLPPPTTNQMNFASSNETLYVVAKTLSLGHTNRVLTDKDLNVLIPTNGGAASLLLLTNSVLQAADTTEQITFKPHDPANHKFSIDFGAGIFFMTNNWEIDAANFSGTFTGDGRNITNVPSTNIASAFSTLTPTSATNYTAVLRDGELANMSYINTANTNAWVTFSRTNIPNASGAITFNALTSSVPCKVHLTILGWITNANSAVDFTVTNGTLLNIHLLNFDSTGTNIEVSAGGVRFHK